MKKLAIIGHPVKGDKIIEILKMLGGKNKDGDDGWKCKYSQLAYYIDDTGWIEFINTCNPNENILRYTLEEFLEKYPYKIGDKVKVPYEDGRITGNELYEYKILKIKWDYLESTIKYGLPTGNEQCIEYYSTDNLNIWNKKETAEEKGDKAKAPNLIGEDYYGKRSGYKIPNGYELDCIKNNEIILKPKQPQYPKTYEECCEVLGYKLVGETVIGYDAKLITSFQRLKVCRDAYWKIAGEQMGLGKPWEPDFKDDIDKYFICYLKDEIWKSNIKDCNRLLVFPTEKIRDEFYENFKDLIKVCKNLI